MVRNAGFLHQLQVPLNLPPFAFGADALVAVGAGVAALVDIAAPEQGVVLAVSDNGFAQSLGPEHGLTHGDLALDAPAIVGKAHHIGSHALQVGEGIALLAHGDGTVGIDMDAGGTVNDIPLKLQVLYAVGNGI